MRYFILLLINLRDNIKLHLGGGGGGAKNRSLSKDGAGKYSLFIMEDRMFHITPNRSLYMYQYFLRNQCFPNVNAIPCTMKMSESSVSLDTAF